MTTPHINLSKILTTFVLFIGILLTLSLVRNINTITSANERIEETRNKLARLEKENLELKNKALEVDTPQYREKQARDQLGMAREGEAVAILPSEDILRKLSSIVHDEPSSELPDPNWEKWMKLFF